MRAVEPRDSGHLKLRGFTIFYEDFGDSAAPPMLLLPTWHIAPSLHWKMQVPFLARSRRVVTFDPPGIGGGERTTDIRAFEDDRVVDYSIGLLDHLDIERPDVLGFSRGGAYGLWMAARFPERVNKLILLAPSPPERRTDRDASFWEVARLLQRLGEEQRELLAREFRGLARSSSSTKPVNRPTRPSSSTISSPGVWRRPQKSSKRRWMTRTSPHHFLGRKRLLGSSVPS